ncbi:MAG: class I adenylate-forming enzyme family protein, partial [Gammaproteobacteria bacterium]
MNTVRSLIDRHAHTQPQGTFLIAPEKAGVMTYERLRAHALDIAARLAALDVGEGGKVAFLLPNGYWTAALFLGVMYSGRVVVPLNAVSGDAALSFVIEHSDCRVLFVDEGNREKYAGVLAAVSDNVRVIPTGLDEGPEWPEQGGAA